MELLIPGLILVALMVWVSTKIKKAAAAAYSEETVTTDDFTITKPEGFIIPVNDGSPFLFEARTKEYENVERESIPAASATITANRGDEFDSVCESVRSKVGKVVDDDVHREGSRVCVVTAEENENGVSYMATYKIIEAGESPLTLHARTLPEQNDELTRKIEAMVRSFSAN